MKTAAIIPNWQGRDLLERNLPSVLKVGFDEVIVVDDASTDDSVDFLQQNFPTIHIVRHKENKGFSSSINDGVKATSADVVFLLNTDVVPSKNTLKPALKHFLNQDVFGVSLGETGYSYAIPKVDAGFVDHAPGPRSNESHNTFWISGGSGAFRRSMWQKLGGMDTMFNPFYWEDIDLSFRALKRDWKLVWEPKAQVMHKHESTINTKNFSKKYMDYIKERNQLLFHWKNLELGWLLTKHIPGLLWRLRHMGYFVPVFLALVKLPQLIVRRIKLGKEAKVSSDEILKQSQS